MASIRELRDLDESAYSRQFRPVMDRLGATRFIACDGCYYPIISGGGGPVTRRYIVADPCRSYALREICLIRRERVSGHPLAHTVCETGIELCKPEWVFGFMPENHPQIEDAEEAHAAL